MTDSTTNVLTRGLFSELPEFGRVFTGSPLPFETFLFAWSPAAQEDRNLKGSFHRWHKIFSTLLAIPDELSGPTLDVASGHGLMYPGFKRIFPLLMPYSVAEMTGTEGGLVVDGDPISILQFECDKDLLPAADDSFGLISFCDVLEHLIVDPVWTLLEFNRVLRIGGHLLISTPNAIAFDRVFKILAGMQPGTETEYKPTSIYQRHNREWTPYELISVLNGIGFEIVALDTYPDLFPVQYNPFYDGFRKMKLVSAAPELMGPEIVLVARKTARVTLNDEISKDRRWPAPLYTGYDAYRCRPKEYPKLWGSDYG
jgi:SAM-dependent methyltransferase